MAAALKTVVPLSLSQDLFLSALSRTLEVSLKFDKSHLLLQVGEVTIRMISHLTLPPTVAGKKLRRHLTISWFLPEEPELLLLIIHRK